MNGAKAAGIRVRVRERWQGGAECEQRQREGCMQEKESDFPKQQALLA